MITALKNVDVLTTSNLPVEQYLANVHAIHKILTIGATKLLPLIEPAVAIVSSLFDPSE